MPRNGSGTYTLPEAAFIPNTAISSAAVNSDFSDLASAMTGSLARDGQGGMTAVLPLANAGFTYLADPNTGVRRTAADTQAIFCGSIDVITATITGASVTGDLDVSGVVKVDGSPILPIGLGPLPWSGLTAPPKWIFARGQSLLRADFPDLWTFAQTEIAGGNTLYNNGNGTTTFGVTDMTGYIPAGRESVATRLTSSFFGGNSTILGATGGLQSHTLTNAQLPTGITSSGSNSITVTTAQKVLYGPNQGSAVGGGNQVTAADAGSGGTLGLLNSTGSNSIAVTSNNTSGSAHNNVQPTTIVNFIIYAGA